MIVADTNIISYLFLPTNYSDKASQLFQVDPDWAAPELWRSEFRNVLALYLRQNILSLTEALAFQDEAELMMADREFSLPSVAVMNLVASSTCSAYDCEFLALARQLSVKLVTQDKKLLREFPETAVSLDEFLFQASTSQASLTLSASGQTHVRNLQTNSPCRYIGKHSRST